MTANFEKARKECKLTQTEVSKILNITQATLSSYETGRTEPDIEMLCKLAKCYGTTIDYLLGYDNSKSLIVPNEKKATVELLCKLPEMYYANIEGRIQAYAQICNIN